jgi:hypothetical protein
MDFHIFPLPGVDPERHYILKFLKQYDAEADGELFAKDVITFLEKTTPITAEQLAFIKRLKQSVCQKKYNNKRKRVTRFSLF